LLAAAIAVLLSGSTSTTATAAQKFIPFDQIRKGMRGHGLTVFEGTRPEEFPVEVIGLLPDIAPRRNLFLVRLSGERVERSGVAAGMSGSPIYLDGSLAGALSYTWGFSREPVAAVTPIHEMLDLLGEEATRSTALPAAGNTADRLRSLAVADEILQFFDRYFERIGRPAAASSVPLPALPVPLAVSGIDLAGHPALARAWERNGFLPIPAAPIAAAAGPAEPSGETAELVPGAAVAVKLVRGDLDISGVGTVTHIEGDRVLAFGHPLMNLGSTDLPMALAEVQTIIPSLNTSFKFATPLEEVGSFRQDRTAGLAGISGRQPEMVPVRLEIDLPENRSLEFRFEVVKTPYLSPYLLYGALNGILSSVWKEFGEATVEIQEGSTFLLLGMEENVSLQNLFAGPASPYIASATIAFIYHILMSNEYQPAQIAGINLRLRYAEEPRVARIDRIWLDRGTVRPGETVNLSVALRPFRQEDQTRTLGIEIPEEIRPGRLLLQVGDGMQMSRREMSIPISPPRDLEQLIFLINHLRTNDKIYVLLTREGAETIIRGERFSLLPPSRASILLEPQVNEDLLHIREQRITEDSIDTPYVISGHRSLVLEVR
jgi:hypothetical protein